MGEPISSTLDGLTSKERKETESLVEFLRRDWEDLEERHQSNPDLPGARRFVASDRWWILLPLLIAGLESHCQEPAWTDLQWDAAIAVAEFLAVNPIAPRLSLRPGEVENNRAELVRLGEWFRETAKKPECFARMVTGLERGPFWPLPVEVEGPLENQKTTELGDGRELRIGAFEDDQRRTILQGATNGVVQWSFQLDEVPAGDIRFWKLEPLRGYGSKIGIAWGTSARRPQSAQVYFNLEGVPICYSTN